MARKERSRLRWTWVVRWWRKLGFGSEGVGEEVGFGKGVKAPDASGRVA